MDERTTGHVPVLIVDDDEVTRQALRDWLEDEGYGVWEAADGIDALYILDHEPSAVVVVTDHAMPRLDGRGLLDYVTNSAEMAARTVFIYMTAGDRIISSAFASELAAHGVPVLRKPFDLATLTSTVAEAEARLRKSMAGRGSGRGGLPGKAPASVPTSPPATSPPAE
jgi:CheY-like chemotaxis protein